MIFGIGSETVTVAEETRDRFGDRVYTAERVVYGCAIVPRASSGSIGSSESNTYRESTVITGLTLFAPPNTGLKSSSRVTRADGTKWEVEGEPGVYTNPIGSTMEGEQVQLKRVTG